MNPIVRHFLDTWVRSIARPAEFAVACETAATWALSLPSGTRTALLLFADEVTRRVREKENENG